MDTPSVCGLHSMLVTAGTDVLHTLGWLLHATTWLGTRTTDNAAVAVHLLTCVCVPAPIRPPPTIPPSPHEWSTQEHTHFRLNAHNVKTVVSTVRLCCLQLAAAINICSHSSGPTRPHTHWHRQAEANGQGSCTQLDSAPTSLHPLTRLGISNLISHRC